MMIETEQTNIPPVIAAFDIRNIMDNMIYSKDYINL